MQMSVAGFSGCYNFCIVDVDHKSNVSMLKMTLQFTLRSERTMPAN